MSAQPILLTPESAPVSGHASLTPAQQAVAAALAAGSSISAAAASAGVHRSSIHNWFKSTPAFHEAIEQAKAHYAESLKDQLRDLSKLALDNLQALLTDPNCPYSVRLRASLAVLNRPTFPDPSWTLPVSVNPDEDYFTHGLRAVERELKVRRQLDQIEPTGEQSANLSARLTPPAPDSTIFDTSTESVELSNPPQQTKPDIHQTPRNAACPAAPDRNSSAAAAKPLPPCSQPAIGIEQSFESSNCALSYPCHVRLPSMASKRFGSRHGRLPPQAPPSPQQPPASSVHSNSNERYVRGQVQPYSQNSSKVNRS